MATVKSTPPKKPKQPKRKPSIHQGKFIYGWTQLKIDSYLLRQYNRVKNREFNGNLSGKWLRDKFFGYGDRVRQDSLILYLTDGLGVFDLRDGIDVYSLNMEKTEELLIEHKLIRRKKENDESEDLSNIL